MFSELWRQIELKYLHPWDTWARREALFSRVLLLLSWLQLTLTRAWQKGCYPTLKVLHPLPPHFLDLFLLGALTYHVKLWPPLSLPGKALGHQSLADTRLSQSAIPAKDRGMWVKLIAAFQTSLFPGKYHWANREKQNKPREALLDS